MKMHDSRESLSPKEKSALKLIREDGAARDLFFKRVSDPKWFFPLLEEGYFAAGAAPGPQAGDQEGFYTIPFWNVLEYLEKISLRSDHGDYQRIVASLIQIIRDVSTRRDENDKLIDNYRTWTSFVSILSNLPNHSIPSDVIDLIPNWLDTRFGTMLQGHELSTKLLPKLVEANDADSQEKAEKLLCHLLAVHKTVTGSPWPDRFVTAVDSHSLLEAFVSEKSERFRLSLSPECISIISRRLRDILRQQRPQSREFDFDDSYVRVSVGWSQDYLVFVKIEELAYLSPTRTIEDWFREEPRDIPKVLCSEEIEIREFESAASLVKAVASHRWRSALVQRFVQEQASKVIADWYPCLSWDLSYIWFTSLVEFKRLAHDAEELLVMILRSVLSSKSEAKAPELVSIIRSYLSDEYPFAIFRRLAIFVLAKQFRNRAFGDIREQLFRQWLGLWLYDIHYERELVYLLEENCGALSPDEVAILRSRIAEYEDERSNDIQKAYWKQRWYSALKSNREFELLYQEMRNITRAEERPSYFVESMQGPGKSPYTIDELLTSSNEQFANALLGFRGTNKWDGPTLNGLAQALGNASAAQPDEIISRLTALHKKAISFIHVYHVLDGIATAWNDRKTFDWGSLLAFMEDYVGQPGFWQNEYRSENDDWKANNLWIIGATSRLLGDAAVAKSGDESREWSFPGDLNSRVKSLLLKFSKEMREDESSSDDPVSALLNTSRGKLVTALENLGIKIKHESGGETWDEAIRSEFDRLIALQVRPVLTLIGFRYIFFRELDRTWLEKQVTDFANLPDDEWRSFFCGYLSHISRPGADLYKLMAPHYERALGANLGGSRVESHLVAHLADEYIDALFPPEASIFARMIQQWRPSRIRELVGFFFMNRGPWQDALKHGVPLPESPSLERFRTKAIGVWELVREHYANGTEELSKDDRELISHSALLISFLPCLDADSTRLLKFSSQFPRDDFNSADFLKTLNRLKSCNPDNSADVARNLADILDSIMKSDVFLTYPEKAISDIVDFICSNGDQQIKGIGLEICNRYAERGTQFLRAVYQKHTAM